MSKPSTSLPAAQLYRRYKDDPNFRDLVNRLLEVMEMYRWSTGDNQDQYEQWYQDAVQMAEQIHDADERHIRLDEDPTQSDAVANLGEEF
jgi:hypothetical protein